MMTEVVRLDFDELLQIIARHVAMTKGWNDVHIEMHAKDNNFWADVNQIEPKKNDKVN